MLIFLTIDLLLQNCQLKDNSMTLAQVRNIPLFEHLFRLIPDSLYISLLYKKNIGRWPSLSNPQTFTEKLQWLKLHNRRPEYSTMVDKYYVKEYVAKKIGAKYVIPTLAVWDSIDDINLNQLPDQFVLKWNHDSGSVVICKDKSTFDLEKAKLKLISGQKANGFWYGREWPYKNVKPVLIAEEYLIDEDCPNSDVPDYKFFCFNGTVHFFKIDFDRYIGHKANYFDRYGNLQLFGETVCPPDFERVLDIPSNLQEMVSLAETLARDIPFVRIDFYNIQSRVYFGEITFYPASGFGTFTDMSWDYKLGHLIELK